MSAFVDAVRSANRMRRYERLRRAEGETRETRLVAALFVWGVPALAPLAALLAVAAGRDSSLLEVGIALGVSALEAHLAGPARLHAFDLLHQPSRGGFVLGHALRRAPQLAWIGLTSAAAWLILMPWLPDRVGGSLMLAAILLAPFAFALNAGAVRLARRAGHEEAAWLLPLLLPVIGLVARAELPDATWAVALPYVGGAVGIVIVVREGALGSAARQISALTLVVAVAGLAAAPGGPAFTSDSALWIAVGAAALAAAIVVLVLALRTQLRCVRVAEIVETSGEGGPAPVSGAAGGALLRRDRAGAGLWAARLRMAADAWLPDGDERKSAGRALSDRLGGSVVLSLTVARGPVLAALAVALAGSDTTIVWLAVLAACFAARIAAVDRVELQPRLWLLGVDYREQVLQGLRSLLVTAALPTLAVAGAALLLTDPTSPGRQAALLVIAGTFVLRAGLPGLWPLQETQRLRLAVVWLALMTLAVAYEMHWPALDAAYAAGVLGAIGLVLLIARFLRLREPHLAECVRRDEEP